MNVLKIISKFAHTEIKMKIKSIIALFIVAFSFMSSVIVAQDNKILELTAADVTLFPKVTSDYISIWNIKLGMTREDAEKILKENVNLFYYVDKAHTTSDYRLYVYDKKDGVKSNCVLYLIWENNGKELSMISFFKDIKKYLIDNTQKLLTYEAYDSKTPFSIDYLGQPDKEEITLDVPSIKYKHTTRYYYSRGIEMVLQENEGKVHGVVFAFVKHK